MHNGDVLDRPDIEDIITRFYEVMLKDPIIGFIFTDIAKVDLTHHLPVIVDFWEDALFKQRNYHGNTLKKHLEIHMKMPLRAGHFTRWLYLFDRAVDAEHQGPNAEKMKQRAEMVAKAIAAAITNSKRKDMNLTLK